MKKVFDPKKHYHITECGNSHSHFLWRVIPVGILVLIGYNFYHNHTAGIDETAKIVIWAFASLMATGIVLAITLAILAISRRSRRYKQPKTIYRGSVRVYEPPTVAGEILPPKAQSDIIVNDIRVKDYIED
jgi:hypothetical protein